MNRVLLTLTLVALTGCTSVESVARVETGPVDRSDLEVRRVWSGTAPDFYVSSPSPDGRFISEVDWATGDLSVIDLETGREQHISDKGTWEELDANVEYSVFSPDGARMAYTWLPAPAPDNPHPAANVLRTIRVDGTEDRTLLGTNPDNVYLRVEDWSSDGRNILVTVFRSDRTSQIGLVSADDGDYRAIKTNGWRSGSGAFFSPDGRDIAYDLPARADALQRDIFILATDGSRETAVVTGPADERILGWVPDGSSILYHAQTARTAEIRVLPVDRHNVSGPSELIRADVWNIEGFGFSHDAFFYGVHVELPQVYVAAVDPDSAQVLDAPVHFGDPSSGEARSVAWSPDGRSLAIVERNGGLGGTFLAVRTSGGELSQRIPLGLGGADGLAWSPKGDAVFLRGTDSEGRNGVHRFDLATGLSEPIVTAAEDGIFRQLFALGNDGQTLYYLRSNPDFAGTEDLTLVARDLATDETRTIAVAEPRGYLGISASPGGRYVALAHNSGLLGTLQIAPISGGPIRPVYEIRWAIGGNDTALPWTPAGDALLFVENMDGEVGGVWRIPTDEGMPRQLLTWEQLGLRLGQVGPLPPFLPIISDLALGPDGRRLAFITGDRRGEYWMISGFGAGDAN